MERTRALSRPRFAAVGLVAAVVAGASIPGHAPGLNWVLVTLLVAAAALPAARQDLDRYDVGFILAGVVLMTFFLFRTAPWLLALNLLGAFGLGAAGFGRACGWWSLAWAPVRLLTRLPVGIAWTLAPIGRWLAQTIGPRRGSVVRAGALTTLLLVVFGTLFASADPAFASLTRLFAFPELDVGLLPVRILMGLLTIATIGALVLVPGRADNEATAAADRSRTRIGFELAPAEWITALVVLDALFASFVILQLTVLFGGRTQVLETAGLTYAQYARGGFFQLVAVAFLTLAVVAGAVRFGDAGGGGRRTWMKILLGGLCALTLVILASAMKRMSLYEEVYGFTRLRLLVDTTILWLAGMFGLLLAAGWVWKASWLPRAALALTAIAVLGLNVVDPDAAIARRNIDRFETTGKLDADYLASLSFDAVPELARLQQPERDCVLARIASHTPEDRSPWAFNVSSRRARPLLERVGEPPASSCPGLLGL